MKKLLLFLLFTECASSPDPAEKVELEAFVETAAQASGSEIDDISFNRPKYIDDDPPASDAEKAHREYQAATRSQVDMVIDGEVWNFGYKRFSGE